MTKMLLVASSASKLIMLWTEFCLITFLLFKICVGQPCQRASWSQWLHLPLDFADIPRRYISMVAKKKKVFLKKSLGMAKKAFYSLRSLLSSSHNSLGKHES